MSSRSSFWFGEPFIAYLVNGHRVRNLDNVGEIWDLLGREDAPDECRIGIKGFATRRTVP